jgi:hypothetical protein
MLTSSKAALELASLGGGPPLDDRTPTASDQVKHQQDDADDEEDQAICEAIAATPVAPRTPQSTRQPETQERNTAQQHPPFRQRTKQKVCHFDCAYGSIMVKRI